MKRAGTTDQSFAAKLMALKKKKKRRKPDGEKVSSSSSPSPSPSSFSIADKPSQVETSLRFPAFYVAGAQKAGTTSLAADMAAHPDLFIPHEKECHFFTAHADDASWYSRKFSGAKDHQICGDCTPYYLFHPFAAKWMQELTPGAKIIVLLRNPVDRAISHFWHARQRHLEELPSFQKALDAEERRLRDADDDLGIRGLTHYSHQKHSYFSRGLYAEQLDRFCDHFARDRILVVRSEDYFSEATRSETLREIYSFLGVAARPPKNAHANPGTYNKEHGITPEEREQLRQRFAAPNEALRARYGISWGDWQ